VPFGYEESRLWTSSLADQQVDPYAIQRRRLASAYHNFRERAALIAAEIPQDLREYTVHDVSHLDALWEMADLIAGDQVSITPTEAFVLGGAFLIHDLGMGLAAWPGGLDQLREEPTWPDILANCIHRCTGTVPTSVELANPSDEAVRMAKEIALRERHAFRAAELALTSWESRGSEATYRLLEDTDLRERYGPLIGEIAASHWWNIDQVAERFSGREPIGAPVDCPDDWTVDELKLACLMRVSDAAHLDERRAPGFLRAVRNPRGYSDLHWTFQGYLQRPRRASDRLVYTSARAFGVDEAAAWWVCFESLQMVDGELSSVDSLLTDRGRPRFAARGVRGIEDPSRLASYIRTDGWTPIDARPRIDNVPALVRRLGGESLYGAEPLVPLRELIQNARDASKAYFRVIGDHARPIQVELTSDEEGVFSLTVNDFGVGMSSAVLSRTLLDFGQSYWGSDLMRREFPGLSATPFSAIGRFGIGFYSVFMLGDDVKVITRRYDEASSDTRVLHFQDGVSARPILRPAAASEIRHFGGTSVTVRLRQLPEEEGGLLRLGRSRLFTLAEACGFMAPALDVDLESRTGTEAFTVVVSADDWKTMPGVDLLRRIAEYPSYGGVFPRAHVTLDEVGAGLQTIAIDGETVARAALAPSPPVAADGEHVSVSSCVTIGGLRAGSDLGGVAGIVVGRPTTADRIRYELELSEAGWKDWATDQASRWAGTMNAAVLANSRESSIMVDLVLRLGGEPAEMLLARTAMGLLTIEQFGEWAAGRNLITFVNAFGVDTQLFPDGELRVWHSQTHDRLILGDDVVVGDFGSRYGSWQHYGDERPDKTFAGDVANDGTPSNSRGYYYNAQRHVEGELLRAIAAAWSISLQSLLDRVTMFELRDAVPLGVGEDGDTRYTQAASWQAARRSAT